jgi:hypothetical protein
MPNANSGVIGRRHLSLIWFEQHSRLVDLKARSDARQAGINACLPRTRLQSSVQI